MIVIIAGTPHALPGSPALPSAGARTHGVIVRSVNTTLELLPGEPLGVTDNSQVAQRITLILSSHSMGSATQSKSPSNYRRDSLRPATAPDKSCENLVQQQVLANRQPVKKVPHLQLHLRSTLAVKNVTYHNSNCNLPRLLTLAVSHWLYRDRSCNLTRHFCIRKSKSPGFPN